MSKLTNEMKEEIMELIEDHFETLVERKMDLVIEDHIAFKFVPSEFFGASVLDALGPDVLEDDDGEGV